MPVSIIDGCGEGESDIGGDTAGETEADIAVRWGTAGMADIEGEGTELKPGPASLTGVTALVEVVMVAWVG